MDAMPLASPTGFAAVALALMLGGILKGATGAGAPIIAVPVIAAVYDVRVAVALMVVPNLVTNLFQLRRYRRHALEPGFARRFAIAGMAGAGVGTFLLVRLPVTALQIIMAALILAYIALRLARPDLRIPLGSARWMLWPAGFAGGILQGAVGVSAPVSITFLNAMRLARPVFIFTVSGFFVGMCMVQLPLQVGYGLMTREVALLGVAALLPIFAAMPVGEWIGRRISAATFDRVILVFLGCLAIRLVWDEIA